jgi:hypothetical protein
MGIMNFLITSGVLSIVYLWSLEFHIFLHLSYLTLEVIWIILLMKNFHILDG